MDFYDGSAESASEQSGDNMLEDCWSISNSTDSVGSEEEIEEVEDDEDETEEVEEVEEVEIEEDNELALYSDLSMKVIYHCSVCGICTDNPHIMGCPYYCFGALLQHYQKSE